MHPLERYLSELRDLHLSGAGVPETSGYPVLKALLDEVGRRFTPRTRCIIHPANAGAGIPDGGLYTSDQFPRRGRDPREGTLPSAGAIEVKPVSETLTRVVGSSQVNKYLMRYGQVLLTNYREFTLLVRTSHQGSKKADSFTLADSEDGFWTIASHPHRAADERGERLIEFLTRVLRSRATLNAPEDVAWFLASYARDAMDAIEGQDLPALATVRKAFEEALGITFQGERGDHFFRSSLIQTLFYGVFSGWVLWSRENPPTNTAVEFDWKDAAWYLKVPAIEALFGQIAQPGPMRNLGIGAILDRAADVLNRVDRADFFRQFQAGDAVQYFYEPFLEAFDPELRKELGVWYTPREIVQYMVARVDTVLKEELGIPRGLADPQVYVLDPCCGTGAYLVEVLRTIARTLKAEGADALASSDVRNAAMERVFGFEILAAPFVVAHLQLGLLLQTLGAPLGSDPPQRAGVYLTNALTGWESRPETHLPFPELEQERDLAEDVKRAKPILVILGNPPYNGFAGVTASDEERRLTDAYRKTKRTAKPQGQGLNDLYVRFFRMAERKIVEHTGRGIVCFISNYSWLDGLSFTGMRERYLEVFDQVWIDCLNGDRYRTGKLTPEGDPDPSIFSTEQSPIGIQVGTAVALLVRSLNSAGTSSISFRHLWGESKRSNLQSDSLHPRSIPYEILKPVSALGCSFHTAETQTDYLTWPSLIELIPAAFPGVQSKRDTLVVDIDRNVLLTRMEHYFDPRLSDDELAALYPAAILTSNKAFDLRRTRAVLIRRGFLPQYIVSYCYRPMDIRWIYWEPDEDLLGRKSPELFRQTRSRTPFLEARQRQTTDFDRGYVVSALPDNFGNGFSSFFPRLIVGEEVSDAAPSLGSSLQTTLNLSSSGLRYASTIRGKPEHIFHHAVAVLNARTYRTESSGALRIDWPRIPLPETRELLDQSASLGTQVAGLLDPQVAVEGVTMGTINSALRGIGGLSSVEGAPLDPARGALALSAGWGFRGTHGVMPGPGQVVERGIEAVDIYLNERAYWANVPGEVWDYTISGYQVIKKWLSYREKELLGRDLTPEEARYVTEMVRRIAAILALGPALDENYERVKASAYAWEE